MNVLHKTRCSADLKISAFEKQGGEVRFPDNPFYNIQVNGKYDERVCWISKKLPKIKHNKWHMSANLQSIWKIFKEWILDNWKGFPLIHDFEFCFPRPINLLWEMLLTIDNASGAKRGRIEEINIYFVKQISRGIIPHCISAHSFKVSDWILLWLRFQRHIFLDLRTLLLNELYMCGAIGM